MNPEWLITNGIGGYASGTVDGCLTRGYHGLLIAALSPPLQRTLLVTKLDEIVTYKNTVYPLYNNRWGDGTEEGRGAHFLEDFHREGTTPVWRFALSDARLEKRIWMQPEANTTYINYTLVTASDPLKLSLKVLVNYRDHHSRTQGNNWQMQIDPVNYGVKITAFQGAIPFYILCDRGSFSLIHIWHYNYQLTEEKERGLYDLDDHLQVATIDITLVSGESVTIIASSEAEPPINFPKSPPKDPLKNDLFEDKFPVNTLLLAADQFIVKRPLPNHREGKTIIAGYPWFTDWGRDTMISLPGLTIATGKLDIARSILLTFSEYVSQGMLPNRFPDDGTPLGEGDYNTVDATLWYFEAIRAYYEATGDKDLLTHLYPILEDIIAWHCRGTRYNIHLDPTDGLIYAGVEGKQLTWMDAKIASWVVTPRIGKPIEINALWYNAIVIMFQFSQQLQRPDPRYQEMASATLTGFQRFWNEKLGYCFDVLDTSTGNDPSLRPNQIFAVSLPFSPLNLSQQKSVVDTCQRELLTPYGLRSLAPFEKDYQGHYGGSELQRDGAYHQGTVWGWLLGPFVIAHLKVYQNPRIAQEFLHPMLNHLNTAGLGTISEIFDGDPPFAPKGCIAQAWSVAEFLRAWLIIGNGE